VLWELVAAELGTAIVPESMLGQKKRSGIQAAPIADSMLLATSGLIWMKGDYLSKAAQHFIALASALSPADFKPGVS